MGAVHDQNATCVFDPGHLLQHVFHIIQREPPHVRLHAQSVCRLGPR